MISRLLMLAAISLVAQLSANDISAQQAAKMCFTAQARALAERSARVWMEPDPGYDPVLGYISAAGPRRGAPPVDDTGRALAIKCLANKDLTPGSGTTPKFHCSVAGVSDDDGDAIRYKVKPHFKGQTREKRNGEINGEFLSSRFSKALGFFADDQWVADVTCPDCESSLTGKFQGTPFNPFQPAAGIELPLGKGIDKDCDDKDTAPISRSLEKLIEGSDQSPAIDAFKLWLAFIDHGDTKTDNQKYTCLETVKNANGSLGCAPGRAVFYVSDMGSTFGFSGASENKARLERWKGKDPIKAKGGQCSTTAKNVGDPKISESGRALLADELRRLLDAEKSNGTITKVFRASRNEERDQPAEAWTAEFIRKARTIIDARCGS
ncbi:MAG: hypothetical protein WKF34_00060 [Pyrinomonadaceae bacterium]